MRESAIDTPKVRTVLFVCTGNTCRSPMAEAIGRGLAVRTATDSPGLNIFSAGTGAAHGLPATPEASRAVERLGFEMPPHRSTGLSREMIEGADAVYAMTRGHLEAIRDLAPDSMDRVSLLDPQGTEIPDPIGFPQHVYDEAAQQILAAIKARLNGSAPGL